MDYPWAMIGRVKICIVSDSHDRADALERAVCDAAAEGAQAVVHCGDLIGAHTLRPALRAGIPMHVIHGNNLGDPLALHNLSRASGGLLHYHGPDARLELGGRIERVATVKGGSAWLVNPGTIAGLSAPATWVLGDLGAMRYEVFKLSMAA